MRKTTVVQFRVTGAQLAGYRAAARAVELTLSEWAREAMRATTERPGTEAIAPVTVPAGAAVTRSAAIIRRPQRASPKVKSRPGPEAALKPSERLREFREARYRRKRG